MTVLNINSNAPGIGSEAVASAFDQFPGTKWYESATTTPTVSWQESPARTVDQYVIFSANDAANRDPAAWNLYGSNDNSTWTLLDSRTGQSFASRFLPKTYTIASPAQYAYYKWEVTANNGSTIDFQVGGIFLIDQKPTGSFAPPSGCVSWVEASSHVNRIDEGGLAATWLDKSGNGNHWWGDTSSSTNQPALARATSGGAVWRFTSGLNIFSLLPAAVSSLTAAEYHILYKSNADPPTGSENRMLSAGSSGQQTHLPYTDGNLYDDFGSTTRRSVARTVNVATAYRVYRATSTSTLWENAIDGTVQLTTGTNTVGWRATPLLGSGTGNGLLGDIVAIMIFNRALTSGERTTVQTYLKSLANGLTDNWADAPELPSSGLSLSGLDMTSYTTEASEPGSLTNTGWARFKPGVTGRYLFDVSTNSFNARVALYTGTSLASLSQVQAPSSRVFAQLTAGVTYYVQVGTSSGAAGSLTLSVSQYSPYVDDVKRDSPFFIWGFDSSLNDSSGNSRNAVANTTGVGSFNYVTSRPLGDGQALQISGGADGLAYLQLSTGTPTWNNGSGYMTLEFVHIFQPGKYMLCAWNVSYLDIIVNDGGDGYLGLNVGTGLMHGVKYPRDGKAHHVAYVIPIGASTNNQKVYIDGMRVLPLYGTALTTPSLTTQAFKVNGWYANVNFTLPGMYIDNVSVTPGETSAARILSHAQSWLRGHSDGFDTMQNYTDAFRSYGGWSPPIRTTPTYEANEGSEPTPPAADTTWLAFTPPADGTYTLGAGANYDAVTNVYTGSAIGSLTPVAQERAGSPTYLRELLQDNPQLVWMFDEANGAATVADSSGNGRTGTVNSNATLGGAPLAGATGGSAVFTNPANTLKGVSIAAASWMVPGNGFTVEALFTVNSLPSAVYYIAARDNDQDTITNRLWNLSIGPQGYLGLLWGEDSTRSAIYAPGINPGGTYHVIGYVDDVNNYARLYVNGRKVAESSAVGVLRQTQGTYALRVGSSDSTSTGRHLDGRVDYFAFYTGTVLSDDRIAVHAAAARPIAAHLEAGTTYRIQAGSRAASGVASTFSDNFDAQASWPITGWDTVNTGSLTTSTRTGSGKAVTSSGGAQTVMQKNFTELSMRSCQFWFKIAALPGAENYVFGLHNSTPSAMLYLRIGTAGQLVLADKTPTTLATSANGVITADTWAFIDIRAGVSPANITGTGYNGWAELRVNNTLVASAFNVNLVPSSGNLGFGSAVFYSHAGTVYFDDVVVDAAPSMDFSIATTLDSISSAATGVTFAASDPPKTGLLLKGRSTKTQDLLPGG